MVVRFYPRIKSFWRKLLWLGLSLLLVACGDSRPTVPAASPRPTSSPASNITLVAATTAPPSTLVPPLPTLPPTAPPTVTPARRPTTAAVSNLKYYTAAIKKALSDLPGKSSALVILPGGGTVEVGADQPLPSASTIKLWVAATVFEQSQAGSLDLTEKYTVKQADLASGTGILRTKVGTTMTTAELVGTMLTYSDNSATNVLLEKLGGFDKVNAYIAANGYSKTKLQRRLGFLDPTKENYTDARDAATFMQHLLQHEIVDVASSDAILQALQSRLSYAGDQNFFGPKLPKSVVYRHLSGTGTGVRNEVGYIQPTADPSGPPLIIAIYTSDVPSETAAETTIATVIGQIYGAKL